ncbi:MAG: 3-alpha domain-containing protein [Bacillota bacterium]
MDSLRTGFYLRVLEERNITPSDGVTLVRRPAGAPTVAWANRIRHRDHRNQEALRRLLAAEGLAEAWHRDLIHLLRSD